MGVKVLLLGVVGSTAYGLAREGSDVDRLGVFAAPTVEVAGLEWAPRRETLVYKQFKGDALQGDVTMHEVGKFLRLALKCNPSIVEVLWLPGKHIEVMDPFYGARLVALRRAVLSGPAVRNAYGEYARTQADKLRRRGDGSFSADTRRRTAKHARHILRLLRQGKQLLTEGRLDVEVAEPSEYFAFDTMSSEEILDVYAGEYAEFRALETDLPDHPDRAAVAEYLATIRARFMWGD